MDVLVHHLLTELNLEGLSLEVSEFVVLEDLKLKCLEGLTEITCEELLQFLDL